MNEAQLAELKARINALIEPPSVGITWHNGYDTGYNSAMAQVLEIIDDVERAIGLVTGQ